MELREHSFPFSKLRETYDDRTTKRAKKKSGLHYGTPPDNFKFSPVANAEDPPKTKSEKTGSDSTSYLKKTYESEEVIKMYHYIFENSHARLFNDLLDTLRKFESTFYLTRPFNMETITNQFQNLYSSLSTRQDLFPLFQDAGRDEVLLFASDFLASRLHAFIFPVAEEEFQERDAAFQTQVAGLHWVTVEHLNLERFAELPQCFTLALRDLVRINFCVTVTSKMQCILECSQRVCAALRSSGQTEEVTADDFWPALLLAVLRAHPGSLHANVAFIQSLAPPGYVDFGEPSYYFTSIISSILAIENINSKFMNLTEEAFQRNLVSPPSLMPSYRLAAFVDHLKERQARLEKNSKNLLEEMENYESILRKKQDLNLQVVILTRPGSGGNKVRLSLRPLHVEH